VFVQYSLVPREVGAAAGVAPPPAAPADPAVLALAAGAALGLAAVLAPGATFNPLFGAMATFMGVRTVAVNVWCTLAQLLAMLSSHCLTHALFVEHFRHAAAPGADYRTLEAAQLFGVIYPAPWVSNRLAAAASVVAVTMMSLLLFAVAVFRLRGAATLHPFAQGLTIAAVVVLNLVSLQSCGLGPAVLPFHFASGALFLAAAGWPADVLLHHNGYIWVTLWAPFVGAVVCGLLLQVFLWATVAEMPGQAKGRLPEAAPGRAEGAAGERRKLAALLREAAERLSVTAQLGADAPAPGPGGGM